jgi:hypothetical protein
LVGCGRDPRRNPHRNPLWATSVLDRRPHCPPGHVAGDDPPDCLRATFVLAMPPAWLRANVPNVRGDGGETQQTQRSYTCARVGAREARTIGRRSKTRSWGEWPGRSSARISHKRGAVGKSFLGAEGLVWVPVQMPPKFVVT